MPCPPQPQNHSWKNPLSCQGQPSRYTLSCVKKSHALQYALLLTGKRFTKKGLLGHHNSQPGFLENSNFLFTKSNTILGTAIGFQTKQTYMGPTFGGVLWDLLQPNSSADKIILNQIFRWRFNKQIVDGLSWLSANRHLSKIPVSFRVLTPCQRSLYSTKDSIAISIFVDVLVELTNTVFFNSTNIYLQILRR